MVKDRNKGIENISYNHLNLPRQIMWKNMSSVTYMYNALGQKVSKIVTYPDGSIKPVEYLDASTQLSTGYFQYAGEILQFFPHAEGYVDVLARIVDNKPYTYRYKYVYNYTDHLGNIRMSYTLNPQNNKLEILEENHYFPFGLKHSTYIPADKKMLELIVKQNEEKIKIKIVQETEYQYKYNGKEWQGELGLNFYDYGARNYDPALGRWMNVDPLAEKHFQNNPYMYVSNNPNIYVDPDGKDFRLSIKENENGGYDITISSTYHVYSGGNGAANKSTVNSMNTWIEKNFTDFNDGANNISFDIKAIFHDSKEDAIAAVEESPGDNLHGIFQNAEDVGDFELYSGVDRGGYPTAEGLAKVGGRESKASGGTGNSLHELLHNLGYKDRYKIFQTSQGPKKSFDGTNDVMDRAEYNSIFSDFHKKDMINYILKEYNKNPDKTVFRDFGQID